MSFQDYLVKETQTATDFYVPSAEKIELLKAILERQYGRDVSFNEAEEVGIQLISLYECLAHERAIIPGGDDEFGR